MKKAVSLLLLLCSAGPVLAEFGDVHFSAAPEIRTTYQSLGKIVEDRPMQLTNIRFGFDTGAFGRIGVRNWDVSSLTDRRNDVHRHALYHWEFGPTWEYDLKFTDEWKLHTDVTRSWTIYQGSVDHAKNLTYHWWQIDQSLENPYLVPFYRIRRAYHTSDYLYFKIGFRRKFRFGKDFYLTPSIRVEGGNARHYKWVFGKNENGGDWGAGGVSSLTFALEGGWDVTDWCTIYGFVEQYEVVGAAARATNDVYDYDCAHNDWTHGGIGVRFSF